MPSTSLSTHGPATSAGLFRVTAGVGVDDWDDNTELSAKDAAEVAGVSKQLFNYWRDSGKVRPVGTTPDGRPTYRLGDVLDVEAQTRRNPQSRRGTSTRQTLIAA